MAGAGNRQPEMVPHPRSPLDCVRLQLGFATVYNFYAYPDRCRMRLSQILVLPPYQGRGAGALLLRALSQQAKDRNAVDVTVRLFQGEEGKLPSVWMAGLGSEYVVVLGGHAGTASAVSLAQLGLSPADPSAHIGSTRGFSGLW